MEDLTKQLTQLEGRTDAQKVRIEELEALLRTLENEKNNARKETVLLRAQVNEMKKNSDDLDRRCKEMCEARDRSQDAEERMGAQLTAEKARCAALEDAAKKSDWMIVKLKEDRDQAVKDLEKNKVQVKSLQLQVEQLEREVKESEDKNTVLIGRLAAAEEENLQQQRKLHEVEDNLSAKERALSALKEEIMLVNNRLREKELLIATLKEQVQTLTIVILYRRGVDTMKMYDQEIRVGSSEQCALQYNLFYFGNPQFHSNVREVY